MTNPELRHDWTVAEIESLYNLPLPELIFKAQAVHRQYHKSDEVQGCVLLSVKTGGCPEDCAYCPQSAHYETGLTSQGLVDVHEALTAASHARANGATRFCMGAAWRDIPEDSRFDRILEMVRGVRSLGMEACCTLGMLTQEQADLLADAGLTAYNHNLDTAPEYYTDIVDTRTYQDRLDTLAHVRAAGISVCCGGIVGMGEAPVHRAGLIAQLANLDPYPESVPINSLVRVPGTPLADAPPIDPLDFVRMIAVARITMPKARVRLSAGRQQLGDAVQALCFLAGANSIFYGDKLLVTGNPDVEADVQLLARLGLKARSTTEQGACA